MYSVSPSKYWPQASWLLHFSVLSVTLWLRRVRLFASVLSKFLLVMAISPAAAQESPVDLAIKLGSRNYVERATAAKKLEQLGTAALPALRASILSADLETKRRAVVVMERIEDRIMQERVVQPTLIHLRYEKTPLADALGDVEKQTRLRIGGTDRKNP